MTHSPYCSPAHTLGGLRPHETKRNLIVLGLGAMPSGAHGSLLALLSLLRDFSWSACLTHYFPSCLPYSRSPACRSHIATHFSPSIVTSQLHLGAIPVPACPRHRPDSQVARKCQSAKPCGHIPVKLSSLGPGCPASEACTSLLSHIIGLSIFIWGMGRRSGDQLSRGA